MKKPNLETILKPDLYLDRDAQPEDRPVHGWRVWIVGGSISKLAEFYAADLNKNGIGSRHGQIGSLRLRGGRRIYRWNVLHASPPPADLIEARERLSEFYGILNEFFNLEVQDFTTLSSVATKILKSADLSAFWRPTACTTLKIPHIGARIQSFVQIATVESVSILDLESAYPNAALAGLPGGTPIRQRAPLKGDWLKLVYGKFSWKNQEIAPLPTIEKHKIGWNPSGFLEGYVWEHEIPSCVLYEPVFVEYFRRDHSLSPIFEALLACRSRYPNHAKTFKAIANTLIGLTASQGDPDRVVVSPPKDDPRLIRPVGDDIGAVWLEARSSRHPPPWYRPQIWSYVVSSVRRKLFEKLKAVDPICCHTDGIVACKRPVEGDGWRIKKTLADATVMTFGEGSYRITTTNEIVEKISGKKR